jgi:hypothetical protein
MDWTAREVPVYAGQTRRLSDRMWDYCEASYYACADFRVGEAIHYLRESKRCRITLRYKATETRREEEYNLIRELVITGTRLLNQLPAYDFRNVSTNQGEERRLVQRFCDMVIRLDGSDASKMPLTQKGLFEGFTAIEFPTLQNLSILPQGPGGFVYVIFWALADRPTAPRQVHRSSAHRDSRQLVRSGRQPSAVQEGVGD